MDPMLQAAKSRDSSRWRRHRREVNRQIVLPFVGGTVVIGLLALGAGWAGLGTSGLWADLALVWLTVLAMLGGLVVLVVILAGVAASEWLIRQIPPLAAPVQEWISRVPPEVERAADLLVRPVIGIRSLGNAVARVFGRRT